MKLAGITWWRNNYGSILQAYALQTALASVGGVQYEILCQYGKEIGSLDNLLDKWKTYGLAETVHRAFWRFGIPPLRKRSAAIQNFVHQNLRVSEQQYSESTIGEANARYDGFLCGSDQIWNPTLTDVHSMYWLTFAQEDKLKIAYAPSIGAEALSEPQKTAIRENLSRFQAISCREESGTRLLNAVLGEEKCQTVLDPTLLVSRTLWDQMSAETEQTEPYLFVYLLRGTKAQRRMAEAFAARNHLKIYTMPFLDTEHIVWYDWKFGDKKIWAADPADFVSLIRNAAYVVTDSFHAMVFSCLYHKTYFAFQKRGAAQHSRMADLQQLLGIEDRIMDDSVSAIDEADFGTIPWDLAEERLQRAREKSKQYLLSALEMQGTSGGTVWFMHTKMKTGS